jgi:hypothetical protein
MSLTAIVLAPLVIGSLSAWSMYQRGDPDRKALVEHHRQARQTMYAQRENLPRVKRYSKSFVDNQRLSLWGSARMYSTISSYDIASFMHGEYEVRRRERICEVSNVSLYDVIEDNAISRCLRTKTVTFDKNSPLPQGYSVDSIIDALKRNMRVPKLAYLDGVFTYAWNGTMHLVDGDQTVDYLLVDGRTIIDAESSADQIYQTLMEMELTPEEIARLPPSLAQCYALEQSEKERRGRIALTLMLGAFTSMIISVNQQ